MPFIRLGQPNNTSPIEMSPPNARALARWWARCASGVLRVDDGDASTLIMIGKGGPVGDDGVAGVQVALAGGTLTFDPIDVDEAGERDALAAMLWSGALAVAPPLAHDLMVMPSAPERLTELPSRELFELVCALDEPESISAIAQRLGRPADTIAAHLAPVAWLGLIMLKEVRVLTERRLRPTITSPTDLLLPRSSFAPQAASVPPTQAPTVEPPRAAPRVEPRLEPRPEPRDLRTEPIPIARLRREAELLRHSDGWTTLGIPRGSDADLIKRASQRMRDRYTALSRDPNPDAREYGTEILRRVNEAERTLLADGDTTDPVVAEHLAAGGLALERGDFAKADKHYSAALRAEPNDAAVLGHLAWARFRNPEHKRPAREAEAADYLAMALGFDPDCPVAWRTKADIARANGDAEANRHAMSVLARLRGR